MKIQRLDLKAVGPFTGRTLSFADGTAGMSVIVGDNEAGKSSALRALRYLLFGFPTQVPDDFLHRNPDLRVGALLRQREGEALEFLRRKGNKGTLRDLSDTGVLPDTSLDSFLGGMDEKRYGLLFGLGHDDLVKGGQSFLKGEGDLGQILYSATTGMVNGRQLLESLEKEAEALFKAKGSKAPLNEALRKFDEARHRVKDQLLKVNDWKTLDESYQKCQAEIQRLEDLRRQLIQKSTRLQRRKRTLPYRAQLQLLDDELRPLADAPMLPEDFADRRLQLQSRRDRTQAEAAAFESQMASTRQALEALGLDASRAMDLPRIEQLKDERANCRKNESDLPTLQTRLSERKNQAWEILRGLRPDITTQFDKRWDASIALRQVFTTTLPDLQSLSRKQEGIARQLQEAQRRQKEKTQEEEDLTRQLQNLPEPTDSAALKRIVAGANKLGDVDSHLEENLKALKGQREKLERHNKTLPGWQGTVEELASLQLPLDSALASTQQQWKELDDAEKDLRRELQDIGLRREQEQRNLREVERSGVVPTLNDLMGKRDDRDQTWRQLRTALWDEGLPASSCPVEPDVLESKTSAADQVADQLRTEAELVQRKTAAVEELLRLEHRTRLATEELERFGVLRTAQLAEWKELWEGLGIQPGRPEDMREWRAQAVALRESLEQLLEKKEEHRALETKRRKAREELLGELSVPGLQPLPESERLDKVLIVAEEHLTRLERQATERTVLQQQLTSCAKDLKRSVSDLQEAQQREQSWQNAWQGAFGALGVEQKLSPQGGEELIRRFGDFFDKVKQVEAEDGRVFGMKEAIRDFQTKAGEVLASQAPEFLELEQSVALQRLFDKAEQWKERINKRRTLEEQLASQGATLEAARLELETASKALARLLEQAGSTTEAELPERERQSSRKRDLEKRREEEVSRMIAQGDGLNLEQLLSEIEEVSQDQNEQELSQVNDETEALRVELQRQSHTKGELEVRLRAMDGSSGAAEAEADSQAILAEMVPHIEQYVRLKMAAWLLNNEMERLSRENQNPLLTRAGEFFSRLTLKRFKTLRPDIDDKGSPVLKLVSEEDKEVLVSALSDGTRDQLFLSLRLAWIEQYCASHEPFPVILDDILVNFDDHRTQATLEVLSELSKTTQVILFTHHQTVADQATELGATWGVEVVKL